MEQALTAVCKDIRLGKILIQTNHDTGEPEVEKGGLGLIGGEGNLQTVQKSHTVSLFSLLPAALPPAAEGDKRRLCHPDGQHCIHRGCCHDGSAGVAGR